MNVLVTGGAGYIGSHVLVELVQGGHGAIVIDNLSNSSRDMLGRVEKLVGRGVPFYENDVRDPEALDRIFSTHAIDAVIHLAGLKAVGESVAKPLMYYENNLDSTLSLLRAMQTHGVRRLVFSSSACVYGSPEMNPILESANMRPENPYGRTKRMIEEILEDMSRSHDGLRVTSLRYFNPIGAHESGLLGENPHGVPNNLLPYVSRVAAGVLPELAIFGDDYETPDGTGIRDYVHVGDLARAHVAALNRVGHQDPYRAYNLGSGRGHSVREVIAVFEKVSGKKIPRRVVARRPGDVAASYCDPSRAQEELGWRAELGLERACADVWRSQITQMSILAASGRLASS